MTELQHTGMDCAEFEALLSDALDDNLSHSQQKTFHAHADTCPQCGPLYFEAREGLLFLKTLGEIEPPANLVSNILAATSGLAMQSPALGSAAASPAASARPEWMAARPRTSLAGIVRTAMQPRIAMSFGMAFFSLTLIMNVVGLQMKDLRHLDLRPSAISRQFYSTESHVVKAYENMRFLYEFQARVQDLKKAAETPRNQTAPDEKKVKPGSRKEDRGTSKDDGSPVKKNSSGNHAIDGDRDSTPAQNFSPSAQGDEDAVQARSEGDGGRQGDSGMKTPIAGVAVP